MASLRASRFVQYRGPISQATGLLGPSLTMELHERSSPGITRFRLGNLLPDGQRYATTEPGDDGAVFLFPGTTAEPWSGLIGKMDGELPANPFQTEGKPR